VLSLWAETSGVIVSIEHWTADWRTAFLSAGAKTQHSLLAIVLIDEETLERFESENRSPTDRALLAAIVQSMDEARPKVIGLDFIFDQKTRNDALFIEAIRGAKTPVVLGEAASPIKLTPRQSAFQVSFLKELARPLGYVNIATEYNDVVRFQGAPNSDRLATLSFAEQIVATAGKTVEHKPRRIAWLRNTPAADAFLTIPAWVLLSKLNDKSEVLSRTLDLLKDRIVIVGLDLYGQRDNHWTPLSKLTGEQLAGARVQAYLAAQIWDGNEYTELGIVKTFLISFLIAFVSVMISYRISSRHWILDYSPIVLYLFLDAIAYAEFKVAMPFVILALSWALGTFTGMLLRSPAKQSA
jgi:CHASE2 domain-containing sensor protein